jgi:hypothetical protein
MLRSVRLRLTLATILLTVITVGCGNAESGGGPTTSAASLDSLQLTNEPPPSLTAACAKVAPRTRLEVICPPIAPVGTFTIQFIVPEPGSPDVSYDVQGESGSLHREDGARQNPGHWSFGADASLARLERTLQIAPASKRICKRYNREHRADPMPCQPEVSTFDRDGTKITEYVMPKYPIGGINGGHLVFVWQGSDAAYILSVHDSANRDRDLAMLDGLLAETT